MLILAEDLKATTGVRRPELFRAGSEISISKTFCLNVCQCHKSRSRSSEITVNVTPLSHVSSCQIWSMSVTSCRRCKGNGSVATFREVLQVRGDFAFLYRENGRSYIKCHSEYENPFILHVYLTPWRTWFRRNFTIFLAGHNYTVSQKSSHL